MQILYLDADYVHEIRLVLLPLFPFSWELMRGEGKFHADYQLCFLLAVLNVLRDVRLLRN